MKTRNRRKLNDRFVKTVKPASPTKRAHYYDTEVKGFALQVEGSGHKSFKLMYRRNGRTCWYSIGDITAVGLADARAKAAELQAKMTLDPNYDPHAERLAAQKSGTFAELAARYRNEYAKKRNKSWEHQDYLVQRYVVPDLGRMQVHAIHRRDLRRIFDRLTDHSPSLANQVLFATSAIFAWAIKKDVVDLPANPAKGIEHNPMKARERVLSDSEIPAYWNAFDEAGLVRSGALKMLLLTGQRPGEVMAMHHDHIERIGDGAWWTLPGEPDGTGWQGTKNRQTHRVWLTAPALAILDELDDGQGGFVFRTENGSRLTRLDDAMKLVRQQVQGNGDKVTPHDLRRTHGTTVTGLGFTRDQMNRLQNHKEGGIGSVYDRHSYADEARQIQEAVTSKIMALVYGEEDKVVALR